MKSDRRNQRTIINQNLFTNEIKYFENQIEDSIRIKGSRKFG